MKNVLVLFLSLVSLAASQKEDAAEPTVEPTIGAYPQTWQLVKSTSSWTRTVLTGAALPWQEKYVFRADSTFTKTRLTDNQPEEASGTFSVRNHPDGRYAILTYSQESRLISSCTSRTLKEYLALKANDTIRGTAEACDGPRLEYARVK